MTYPHFEVDVDTSCPRCNNPFIHYKPCQHCEGSGSVEVGRQYDIPGTLVNCTVCYGTGTIEWCPKCGLDLNHYEKNGVKNEG